MFKIQKDLKYFNKQLNNEKPDQVNYFWRSKKGLSEKIIREISEIKKEPAWMFKERLKAYRTFCRLPMPPTEVDLEDLDFNDIYYYLRPTDKVSRRWKDLPAEIKRTYDRLGLPAAEKKYLAGLSAHYESEPVYQSISKSVAGQGVVFTDINTALRLYPRLVKKYFGTVVPFALNKFSALNTAVWSGGAFVYVPRGVKVKLPLQSYFRLNAEKIGQFERTLIIVEPGGELNYIEGCTAPVYSANSLHASVVEIIIKQGARVKYTTIQNWSKNVYNLVTSRALVQQGGLIEWVDGNIGSHKTIKKPTFVLAGRGARAELLSIAFAGRHQHQSAGGQAIHLAPDTSSNIVSKSISSGDGRTAYHGLVKIPKGVKNARSSVVCDALILDKRSRSDTYPKIDIQESRSEAVHEASVGRIGAEQLFYLQSRGFSETEARQMIVSGFIEPVAREMPVEYAAELNQLISLNMEGAVG